jgi:hypothetical protein
LALFKHLASDKETVRYYILPLLPWLEVHHLIAVNRDENHPEAVGISQQRILALPTEYLRSCKWSCGWVNLLRLLWWGSTRPFRAKI